MKLALIGADEESLEFVRWAAHEGGTERASGVRDSRSELVAAFDVGRYAAEVRAIAPEVRFNEDWELLLLGSAVDVVVVGRGSAGLASQTGIADDERRADQLRKLAQAAVPMLVFVPACEAIVGYEIEMIRRDAGGIMLPVYPGVDHPGLQQLRTVIAAGDSSPIGNVEQIVLERQQIDRSRDTVLVQVARDTALIRQLAGTVLSVSAAGPAPATGRDPMGPRPKELPALANLSLHLGGGDRLAARWSIGPVVDNEQGTLTLLGERGRAMLRMTYGRPWSLEIAGDHPQQLDFAWYDQNAAAFQAFAARALAGKTPADNREWLSACRDQEVAEAVDRSLARGRTIELFNEEINEEQSFKGVMAMGGCLLLLMALAVVGLATVVEGLQLPLRDWAVWQWWPAYLLVPVVLFLLLQLLQFAVKRETPAERPASDSND